MSAWQRHERIGDCDLYLGDCREILPEIGLVDSVVADPPYGINGGSGGDARDFRKGAYSDAFADTPEYVRAVCVPALEYAISVSRATAITPGIRCLSLYPPPRDMGCFWTPAACTHGPWGMTTMQPILYYGKDWRAGKGAWPSGRQLTEMAERNGHPCPKPVRAWTWLVEKVAAPGALVLDPFLGSGTTLVACAKSGRRGIGIELDPDYFETACKRVEDAYRQPDLFVDPPKRAEQTDMFKEVENART